tara:strand:- start:372 stop:1058 length:687 start_codon:yes stop_codon:yes gene_type:complete
MIDKKDARREIKFVGPLSSFYFIESWLKTSFGHFRQHFPDRYIRSVYFDSSNLDSYESNIAGISKRMKLRYRWYGKEISPQQGKLEVKRRINSLGWKSIIETDYPVNLDNSGILNLSNNCISSLGISFYDLYKFYSIPIATIGYKRKYFISRDGNIRATIDSNQFYIRQFGKSEYSLDKQRFDRENIILEIKCPENYSDELPNILDGVPLRLSKNSKYVSAVNTLLRM